METTRCSVDGHSPPPDSHDGGVAHSRCLVSVSFLESGTGLTRGAIATATAELVEWGYFARRMGRGKRPSEYFPNWAIVLQPTDANPSVLRLRDACVPPSPDANFASVPQRQDQPHLLSPDLQSGGVVESNSVSAAPTAPPVAALPGATAEAAGFERVWRAYGKLGNKTASRTAFAAIPDVDVDHIATRAEAWAAGAKPGRKRMPLEKWLSLEKWDEADRSLVSTTAPPRGASKPKDDVMARKASIPDVPKRLPAQAGTITEANVERIGDDMFLFVHFGPHVRRIMVEGKSESAQREGQTEIDRLASAAGIIGEIYTQDMLGKAVRLTPYERGPGQWAAA